MKFVRDIHPDRFDAFASAHALKSHFMQSAAWGEFDARRRGGAPRYVGLENERGELAAAALLLRRQPAFFPPYFYAPRGYVMDFFDRVLLEEMTRGVRAFAAEQGAMFVALDPDIERRDIGPDGNPLPQGRDNAALVETLQALGYRHRGFNTGFEGRQPRYTFRIDLTRDWAEIEKGIVGNVLKNVKKSQRYAVAVEKGTSADVADLHRLIGITSERDDFVGYDLSYYQDFFDTLDRHGMATLWIGTVYPGLSAQKLRAEKAELLKKRETLKKPGPLEESRLSEARLDREIALFEDYAREFPDGARISAHLVVRYGDKAWAVHAGSDKRMAETFLNNRVYYEKLRDARENGAALLDQFGTVGDPDNSPLKSLHEFKRQWGGRYIEFIGEFDLVLKPFWFWLYEKVLPMYRSVRIGAKLRRRQAN